MLMKLTTGRCYLSALTENLVNVKLILVALDSKKGTERFADLSKLNLLMLVRF